MLTKRSKFMANTEKFTVLDDTHLPQIAFFSRLITISLHMISISKNDFNVLDYHVSFFKKVK